MAGGAGLAGVALVEPAWGEVVTVAGDELDAGQRGVLFG